MSATSTTTPTTTAFDKALLSFKDGLTDTEKLDFSQTTIDDVLKAAKEIQEKQGKRALLRNLNRIKPYIDGLVQFSKIIEVFGQAKPEIMAFIWGPTKFLLQIASTFTDSFDKLVNALEKIGENLPRFQVFAGVFRTYPRMQEVIVMIYQDILDFHRSTLKFFRARSWNLIFKAMWCTFEERFGKILCDLGRHSILIDSEATAAHIAEAHEARAATLLATIKAQEDRDREDFLSLGKWLNPVDYEARRTNFKPCSTTGTWLIEERDVKLWLDVTNTTARVLWLTAIPGSGKTILSSLMLEHVRSLLRVRGSVMFAFLQNKESSFVTIMQTFVFQLLLQNSQLVPYLKDIWKSKYHPPISCGELENILETMLGNIGVTYLVIDGLDEIELEERSMVLTALLSLLPKANNLKIFLSSRSEVDIAAALKLVTCGLYQVTIGEKNKLDIATYVSEAGKAVLDKFSVDDTTREEIQEILNQIASDAKGMFLWARLVIYNLLQQFDMEGLEEAARNLPSGLDEAYGRILQRINEKLLPKERDLARRVLEWVLCSTRPLRLTELKQAMAIRIGDRCINKRRTLLRRLDELCGPILDIGVEEKVHFVHFTAKEYLCNTYSGPFIEPPVAHRNIASICIAYLSFTCFDNNLSSEIIVSNIYSGEYCLYEYAERHWLDHVRQAIRDNDRSPNGLIYLLVQFFELRRNIGTSNPFLCEQSAAGEFPIPEHWPEVHTHLGVCHAYYSGKLHSVNTKRDNPLSLQQSIQNVREQLENLFTSHSILNDDAQLKFIQCTYGTKLFKCSQFSCTHYFDGFEAQTERDKHLQMHFRQFKCGIDTCDFSSLGFASAGDLRKHHRRYHSDFIAQAEYSSLAGTDPSGSQPAISDLAPVLFDAIAVGDRDAIQALLLQGLDINAVNKNGKTAFQCAFGASSLEILRLLLENGATPLGQVGPRNSKTALQLAINQGSVGLVELLLEWGADPNETYRNGDTALICAARNVAQDRCGGIVQCLLEKGADFKALNRVGTTALIEAAGGGHERVVGLLLEKGADTLSSEGKTALIEAARGGHERVFGLLLEIGADGTAALLEAAGGGHERAVGLLLEKGADGTSALIKAAGGGHGLAVRLLLEKGVDASSPGGKIALLEAAAGGHDRVVRLLLEKGADVNELGKNGYTALMEAAHGGYELAVRLLLEKGADANAPGNCSATALILAARGGHELIVRHLLRHGAHINAPDTDGGTALIVAVRRDHGPIVRCLLESGADVKATAQNGDTAWNQALRRNDKLIIQLLREKGADVDSASGVVP